MRKIKLYDLFFLTQGKARMKVNLLRSSLAIAHPHSFPLRSPPLGMKNYVWCKCCWIQNPILMTHTSYTTREATLPFIHRAFPPKKLGKKGMG